MRLRRALVIAALVVVLLGACGDDARDVVADRAATTSSALSATTVDSTTTVEQPTVSTAEPEADAVKPAPSATLADGDLVLAREQDGQSFEVRVGSTVTVRLVPPGSGEPSAFGAARTNRPEHLRPISAVEDPATGASEAVFRAAAPGDVNLSAGGPCPEGAVCPAVGLWSAQIVVLP